MNSLPRIGRIAYPICLALIVLAQIAVIAPGLGLTRLWEDEAYNLTVPLNLIHGFGYSSDGYLGGGGLIAYDTRISTGPVVLLPIAAVLATGIDTVIGARLVMAVFYIALLAGVWMLGRRIAGRWAALAAVAAILSFNFAQLPSPIQGATDVLGEIPAAACLVWALYFLQRRPWLAGVLLGLAVQSKTLAALAIPALGIGVLFTIAHSSLRARVLRGLVFAIWVVVPSVFFEVVKLFTLGFDGYIENLRAFGAFLRDGGQTVEPVGAGEKVSTLLSSAFVPWWVIILVVVAAVLIARLAYSGTRSGVRNGRHLVGRGQLVLLGVTALMLMTWLGWWVASAHTPAWIRYPATALLVAMPVFAAYFVLGMRVLMRGARSEGVALREPQATAFRERQGPRNTAVVAASVLVALLVGQVAIHVSAAWTPLRGETLPDQRAAAAAVAGTGVEELRGSWGVPVSVAFLAGIPYRLLDATDEPLPLLLGNVKSPDILDQKIRSECDRVLIRVESYAVCLAPHIP